MVASLVVFLNTQLPFTVVPSGRTTLVNCSAVLIISPLNSQFSKMITPKSPLIVTSSSKMRFSTVRSSSAASSNVNSVALLLPLSSC